MANWFQSGKENVVEVLIEAGADVYLANKNGLTPLHTAGSKGNFLNACHRQNTLLDAKI